MNVLPLHVSVNPAERKVEIKLSNHGHDILLVMADDLTLEVRPSPESPTPRASCRRLEVALKNDINRHFGQQGTETWNSHIKLLEIAPQQFKVFNLFLADLQSHPFFQGDKYRFQITIELKAQWKNSKQSLPPIKETFDLDWSSFSIHLSDEEEPGEVIPPFPPEKVMLEYRDVKPFYLNIAEPKLLKLWISGDDQNIWINHSGTQSKLNAPLSVKLSLNPKVTEKIVTTELLEHLTLQFNTQDVKLNKKEKDTLLTIAINNPQRTLIQDTELILVVTLGLTTHGVLSCEVPVLLQRPPFPGHIALDFGTTNSAVAYYDPNHGIPTFPDRIFSDSQIDKLDVAIYKLLSNIDKQVNADKRYQVVAEKMVFFAKMMWTQDLQGNQVQLLNDIRQHFTRLKHRDIDRKQLGEWQARLIVSWGNIGYNELCAEKTPLPVLNFVAQHYFTTLSQIIDIDIGRDAKSSLPELENGGKPGVVPSDIKMSKLKPLGGEIAQNISYPLIDGLYSEIDMGEAVKSSLSNTASTVLQSTEIPNDGKEVHNLYLSAAKRGLGLKESNYFVDGQPQVFCDTYDPLCSAAIRELLKRTEQHINQQKNSLNNIVVTYPANLPQYRRESYRNIMQSLGITHVDMSFDEATAAALYYVWQELFRDLFAGIDGFLARSRVRKEDRRHPVTHRDEKVDFYYQNILLYDMGGGTTDIVLLEIGLEEVKILPNDKQRNGGRYFVIRPKILGLTGREDFGGDNVTLAVFRILKSKLASAAAQLLLEKSNKEGKRTSLPFSVQESLDAFKLDDKRRRERTLGNEEYDEKRRKRTLGNEEYDKKPPIDIFTQWFAEEGSKLYSEKVPVNEPFEGQTQTRRELNELIEALVTTRFVNKVEGQPVFFGLWQEAERIKRGLSAPPEGYEDTPLPKTMSASPAKLLPAIAHLNLNISEMELGNITVSLDEMERLIRKDIKSTFEKARLLCIEECRPREYVTRYMIDRLVLAGSSSHLRLVREEMPFEVLGQSFQFRSKHGTPFYLAAPFKYDGYNLEFNPNDAKLAVVRGGALPRYFKTTRVPPQSPEIAHLLSQGISFIDFDVDNLRNYMPFTLTYATGTGEGNLFESGEKMQEIGRNGKIAIRQRLPPGEIINCYRIDSSVQTTEADKQYYAQFQIWDAFIRFHENSTGEKLSKDIHKTQLDHLTAQYLFWIEFDIERDMKCFMYTKEKGNDDERYIEQEAVVIDPVPAKLADINQFLTESVEGVLGFKPDLQLFCPVGTSGDKFEQLSFTILNNSNSGSIEATAVIKNFRQDNKKGGITRFALAEKLPPVWQIDLQGYNVKNPPSPVTSELRLAPELRLRLVLEGTKVSLKYTVYDPDLSGENVIEIPMSSDTRKAKPPFNPYRGEE